MHRPNARSDSSDDENRRWKVAIKLVATVDLEAVMEYCRATGTVKGRKGYSIKEEEFLTGKSSLQLRVLTLNAAQPS